MLVCIGVFKRILLSRGLIILENGEEFSFYFQLRTCKDRLFLPEKRGFRKNAYFCAAIAVFLESFLVQKWLYQ
jgi:hypothetical protein